jgi:predicted nucleotidyltransferase/HEPN domain-containing protein
MKKSIAHLPAKKQRELEAVVRVIRDAAPVEMVVLFGSHARGDWVDDHVTGYHSDYDLLIVVERSKVAEDDALWSKVEQQAEKLTGETDISLVVHSVRDVNKHLERGKYFFTDIKNEGIALYDSGRFTLAEEKTLSPTERRRQAEAAFARWFESANRFLAGADFYIEKGWCNEGAFQLHQATERYYSTMLLVFTAYKPKLHDIEKLGKLCADLDPNLRDAFPRTDPTDKRLFSLLKYAYVDARYNPKYVITLEELRVLRDRVEGLKQRVERACADKINSLG